MLIQSSKFNFILLIIKAIGSFFFSAETLNKPSNDKTLLLLVGPRGCGKTTLMYYLYDKFHSTKQEILYLFYFLKPSDSIYTVFIDIIKQMRLKYHSKGKQRVLISKKIFFLNLLIQIVLKK